MIPRELIVPYVPSTDLERCHKIIKAAAGIGDPPAAKPLALTANEIHQSWIDACLYEPKRALTQWETIFLINVSDDLTHRGFLTPEQAEKLEEIYTEKT